MTLSSKILADNAVAYLKFDEASGTAAVDTAGGWGNFTYTNGPTLEQTYLAYNDSTSKSVDFDGTNDYVAKNMPGDYTENWSIECWINADSFSTFPGIWGAWTANSNGNYGSTIAINTSGEIEVYLARSTHNAWEFTVNTGVELQTGTTYHIFLEVHNSAATKIARLYVNGVEEWTNTYTNTASLGANGKSFRIGSCGAVGNYFNGRIDEVAIYYGNSLAPLGATKVLEHYNAGLLTQINPPCPNIGVGGNKKADPVLLSELAGTPNKLHASADFTDDYSRIASEGWTYTSNGGTPHYTDVDEAVLNTADFIETSGNIDDGEYKYFSLYVDTVEDPLTDQGHILRYAYKADWSAADYPLQIGVWIYSGSTFVGQYTPTPEGSPENINGNAIVHQIMLPDADAALIDDYSNLFFTPFITGATDLQPFDVEWYWFEFEVPQLQVTGGIAEPTNININGKDATITAIRNIEILSTDNDVNIVGHLATIDIEYSHTETANLTNIALSGNNVTIDTTRNITIQATVSDIEILGHGISIITNTNFLTAPEPALITFDAKDADVLIQNPITINAVSTNINLDSKDTSSAYYNTVLAKTPVHWWRFTEETNPTVIHDTGSTPVDGIANTTNSDFSVGLPGAWSDGKEALILGRGTIGGEVIRGVKFNSTPISNDPNMTLEFWIKPSAAGFNGSAFVNYFTNASTGISGTTDVRTTIGLYQGKAAVSNIYRTSNGILVANIVTVNDNIISEQWNHIVLTKRTIDGTATYKSYVNGQETAIPLSLGQFFTYGSGNITHQSLGTAVNSSNSFIDNPGLSSSFRHTYDEMAVYNYALTTAQVQENYINALLGPLNASILADKTNLYVQGIPFGTQVSINTNASNVTIIGRNPNILNTGSPTIITNAPNIAINGQDPAVNLLGSITINVQKTNISIRANNPKFKTSDVEFIFIDKHDVSLSAIDAEEIEDIDLGGLLYNQIRKDLFKIGNTSEFTCSFVIYVTSKEEQVVSAVQLSKDNVNYSNSITLENIGPNQVSDNVYVKFDVNLLDVLGPGTFLITVEQIYVI